MNSSIRKLLTSGMLLLLSGCVPYHHQSYYPAGGYNNNYGVPQRSYYGGYPYSNHRDERHHIDRRDSFNSRPSWNNRYVRPNPSTNYGQHYPKHGYQPFGHQDHSNHHPNRDNNNWSNPAPDRRWGHNNQDHNWPHSNAQNHRPDQQRNPFYEQRRFKHQNENYGPAWNSRENRQWGRFR